jgi:hypothetical protein
MKICEGSSPSPVRPAHPITVHRPLLAAYPPTARNSKGGLREGHERPSRNDHKGANYFLPLFPAFPLPLPLPPFGFGTEISVMIQSPSSSGSAEIMTFVPFTTVS